MSSDHKNITVVVDGKSLQFSVGADANDSKVDDFIRAYFGLHHNEVFHISKSLNDLPHNLLFSWKEVTNNGTYYLARNVPPTLHQLCLPPADEPTATSYAAPVRVTSSEQKQDNTIRWSLRGISNTANGSVFGIRESNAAYYSLQNDVLLSSNQSEITITIPVDAVVQTLKPLDQYSTRVYGEKVQVVIWYKSSVLNLVKSTLSDPNFEIEHVETDGVETTWGIGTSATEYIKANVGRKSTKAVTDKITRRRVQIERDAVPPPSIPITDQNEAFSEKVCFTYGGYIIPFKFTFQVVSSFTPCTDVLIQVNQVIRYTPDKVLFINMGFRDRWQLTNNIVLKLKPNVTESTLALYPLHTMDL